MTIATHTVPNEVEKQRLSDYLCGVFLQLPSRKSVKKAIKSGAIHVNGKKGFTGDWVLPAQQIEFMDLDIKPTKIFEFEMEVIYQDEDLAVIYKPSGIAVSGNKFRTVENALLYNIQVSSKPDTFKKPRPVHRLDSPTSGLLLIAKTKQARIHLGKQFEERLIKKRYQAIVIGETPLTGTIDFDIEGKSSVSTFERVRIVQSLKNGHLSLLNLYPQTGRTHQLRIHLSKLGYPILGDSMYGMEGLILKHKGLFLAAVSLEFEHPISGSRQAVEIDMPYKFGALLNREQRRYDVYHKE
jgi:23S rRNA pseudouridine1911/1915/1917 synthase